LIIPAIAQWRSAWRRDLWRPRIDPDVFQYLAYFRTVVDEGDDAHGAAALGAA
jgi:hypothetical protein